MSESCSIRIKNLTNALKNSEIKDLTKAKVEKEGSRGGVIVGHRKDESPIYASQAPKPEKKRRISGKLEPSPDWTFHGSYAADDPEMGDYCAHCGKNIKQVVEISDSGDIRKVGPDCAEALVEGSAKNKVSQAIDSLKDHLKFTNKQTKWIYENPWTSRKEAPIKNFLTYIEEKTKGKPIATKEVIRTAVSNITEKKGQAWKRDDLQPYLDESVDSHIKAVGKLDPKEYKKRELQVAAKKEKEELQDKIDEDLSRSRITNKQWNEVKKTIDEASTIDFDEKGTPGTRWGMPRDFGDDYEKVAKEASRLYHTKTGILSGREEKYATSQKKEQQTKPMEGAAPGFFTFGQPEKSEKLFSVDVKEWLVHLPEAVKNVSKKVKKSIEDLTQALTKAKKKDKIPGGLATGKKPSDFDPKALKEGIKVEMEHTSDPKIAEEIAMDHLTEDPNYYKKLKTIEKGRKPYPVGTVRQGRKKVAEGKWISVSAPKQKIKGWIISDSPKEHKKIRGWGSIKIDESQTFFDGPTAYFPFEAEDKQAVISRLKKLKLVDLVEGEDAGPHDKSTSYGTLYKKSEIKKAIAHSELSGVDINTAEHSMDELASKEDYWTDYFKNSLQGFEVGDVPRDLPLDNQYKFTAAQVDDGLYDGVVRNDDEDSGEYGQVVFQIVKMTLPAMVQALKAKGYINPMEKEENEVEESPEIQVKDLLFKLLEAKERQPQVVVNIQKSLSDLKTTLLKGRRPDPVGTRKVWGKQEYTKHHDGWVASGGKNHGKLMGKFKGPVTHQEHADKHKDKGKSIEQQAEDLGRAAFLAGKSPALAQDPAMMKLLEGRQVGSSVDILDAWIRGWHNENLKKPVEIPKKPPIEEPAIVPKEKPKVSAPKKKGTKPSYFSEAAYKRLTVEPRFQKEPDGYGKIILGDGKSASTILPSSEEHQQAIAESTIRDLKIKRDAYKLTADQWAQEYKKMYRLRNLTESVKSNSFRIHRESIETAIQAGVLDPNSKVVGSHPTLLVKYGADPTINLPKEINPEIDKKTNLIASVDFSKAKRSIQSVLLKHVNDCNTIVESMGVRFKTPLVFTCTNLKSSKFGGRFNDDLPSITLMSQSHTKLTIMHEIGHALDYALQEKSTAPRGVQRSQGRAAELKADFTVDPTTDLGQKYKQLYDIVTNSNYYNNLPPSKVGYFKEPTEVFARGFEVYSKVKADKLVEEGKISPDFVKDFKPAIYKEINSERKAALVERRELTIKEDQVFHKKNILTIKHGIDYNETHPKPNRTDFDSESSYFNAVSEHSQAKEKALRQTPEYIKLDTELTQIQAKLNTLHNKIPFQSNYTDVKPDKQKEYETKISEIMEYILSHDTVKKAVSLIDLTEALKKAMLKR